MKECVFTCSTEAGVLGFTSNGKSLTGIYFTDEELPPLEFREDDIIRRTISEINEYFSGKRKSFDIPTEQPGTEFQKEVWDEMNRIEYGKTVSYGAIAEAIGHPQAYRAVGTACGKNRIPIIIPCHRVVSSSGIGGYAGGLDFKRKLLDLEAGHR